MNLRKLILVNEEKDKHINRYKINLGPIGPFMRMNTFFEWIDRIKNGTGMIHGAYVFLIESLTLEHNPECGLEVWLTVTSKSDYHSSFFDMVAIDLSIKEVDNYITLIYRQL